MLVCRLHINVYVSALVMIKEKVIKNISTEITNWFAVWNDDRKFHHIAGMTSCCIHLCLSNTLSLRRTMLQALPGSAGCCVPPFNSGNPFSFAVLTMHQYCTAVLLILVAALLKESCILFATW